MALSSTAVPVVDGRLTATVNGPVTGGSELSFELQVIRLAPDGTESATTTQTNTTGTFTFTEAEAGFPVQVVATVTPVEGAPEQFVSERTEGTPAATADFTDNQPGSTFYQPIRWMQDQGLTNGYQDGSFGVRKPITRAEVASFLYRMAAPEHTAPETSPFGDVSTTNSHYAAITWMQEAGIVGGYQDGSFQPNRPITRGEMAKIIHGVAAEDGYAPAAGTEFTDVKAGHTYYEAVAWLKDKNIVNGYSQGDYRPGQEITRGEVAKILYGVNPFLEGRP